MLLNLLTAWSVSAIIDGVLANHVLHEKRSSAPPSWQKKHKLDLETVIPMKIALQQTNMHQAEKFLYEVSHPRSKKYGQHWSSRQIAETFAPSKESISVVKGWLSDSGIHSSRIKMTPSMSWLHINTTIMEAQTLLKTEYYMYEHEITGVPQVACHEYHVPEHVTKHVDFITPTVHFDAPLNVKHVRKLPRESPKLDPAKKRMRLIRGRSVRTLAEAEVIDSLESTAQSAPLRPGLASEIGTSLGSLPKQGETLAADEQILADNVDACDRRITPACLRALYGYNLSTASNPQNSYGIVEYSPQTYIQEDLDKYFSNFSAEAKGQEPVLKPIDGGVLLPTNRSFLLNGESNLDLEYAMAIVAPMKVTLYQVGDAVQGASFNNFLDAIDGAYCKFNGGDDPEQDAVFPSMPDGYIGPQLCGGFPATKVISTSYGYNEADLTEPYVQRQCAEYLKLALQGVTILYSSGDFGVAGNQGRCIDPATGNYTQTNATNGVFNPTFPSGCPWVTSVGATVVPPATQIARDVAVTPTQPERVCETVIRSGGGFSNVFEMPGYQQEAVKKWFSDHPPTYGADKFNNTQRTRGYPDISVNGANYVITVNGNFTLTYGTSASAPTLGGMIALINEERLNAGKTSVGFINPVLYDNPAMLKDVTLGSNFGCGTPGFNAAPGWDPATGLGTPIYPKMLETFMNLP